MRMITTENKEIMNTNLVLDYFDLENYTILKHSVGFPMDYSHTPHKKYQNFYYYIAQLNGVESEIVYGHETGYVVYYVSANLQGVLDFTKVYCYAFGSFPTEERLLDFELWVETHPELFIKVEFEASELIKFAAHVIKQVA